MNFDKPKIEGENSANNNIFTAENVRIKVLATEPIKVKVLRTGQTKPETGWEVWSVDEQKGTAFVKKFGAEGEQTLNKTVPLDALKQWNS